jgi:type I restriction enzyme S subunit
MLSARNIDNGKIIWEQYRLVSAADFRREHKRTRIGAGDVLLTIVGSIGRTVVVGSDTGPFALQRSVAVLSFPYLDPHFVSYQFQAPRFQHYLAAEARGTAQKGVYLNTLGDAEIDVAPSDEQKRIVNALDSFLTRLDAAVASLERVQAKLKAYRASVLKAAMEGRLVPTEASLARAEKRDYEPAEVLLARILRERRRRWEEAELAKLKAAGKTPKDAKWKAEYEEPAAPDTSLLPDLPDGWRWATVCQVADQRLGKMLDKDKNQGTPRPYLRNANVRWFTFDLTDVSQMRVQDTELDEVSVRAGDLVVCEGGEPGRAAVWQKVDEPFVIQKALHRVRPARGISPWFLAYVLAADAASGRLAKGFTGSTIKHFTGEALRRYCVPLPPEDEQLRMAEAVEDALSLVAAADKTVDTAQRRSARLRQAILKWAFEGKLVDQDPTDQPAEKLLARIKADQASIGQTKVSRGRKVKGTA